MQRAQPLLWRALSFTALLFTFSFASHAAFAETSAATSSDDSTSLLMMIRGALGVNGVKGSGETVGNSITFNGSSITVKGSGTTVDGTTVTISSGGTYNVSGTLDDGQLVVDTDDEVQLNFNGTEITNTEGAPVFISSAEKTTLLLTDGTVNTLTDGSDYVFASGEDEPDATLFSKDDLVIKGGGSLTVNANYKNGITSKDDLVITGGDIVVTAEKHAIKGKDSITISDGTFTLNAGGDGMQSDNDEDADKGTITISGGSFDITAANDAIQAETDLTVSGGTFDFVTGGGSSVTTDDSAKGLKAGVLLTVSGGIFNIDSADDSLHSDADLTIDGGTFSLATGDDGIHAENTLTINDGSITISDSYEGIEAAYIIIKDGDIYAYASDDAINAAGDDDTSSDYSLQIDGGSITVEADGDGIDSNGSITMTGGTVIVHGPTGSGNGAIDYDVSFTITGGILVGASSSGMVQGPSTSSTQNSVLVTLSSSQSSGSLFHVESQSGEEILTFAPSRNYQAVVFSLPTLITGSSYTIYTGGSSTGTSSYGLYSNGTYSPGSKYTDFTITSSVTTISSRRP